MNLQNEVSGIERRHEVEEERTRDPNSLRGEIVLVFDVHVKKKYGVQKQHIANLTIDRTGPARLRDLTEHLEIQLLLSSGCGRRFLLQAVCAVEDQPSSSSTASSSASVVVPLVCDELWARILDRYSRSRLKILVHRNRSPVLPHKKSLNECLFGREVRTIDINRYLPTEKLDSENVMDLCDAIFERRLKIKPSLRKGVWMHLVGVFPPELKARDQRVHYVEQLRMVYDSLKGKWKGEQGERSSQVEQLVEAVHRDAIRTDPNHPFYMRKPTVTESLAPDSICNDQSNVQKLVNIITIYILEHDGVAYTQGMTDLLSPFLYVMNREADAYICFAAMVERIKSHFNTWCEGTLFKIERLRHICNVLDPELYHFLVDKIEEDAFALFFGMVLIECRREFSFEDSFHLFETTWASVNCMRNGPLPHVVKTRSEWAHFMTYESKEVIQQVFGETQSPYSAHPLPSSYSNAEDIVFSLSQTNSRSSAENSLSLEPKAELRVNSSTEEEPTLVVNVNRGEVLSPVYSGDIHQHTQGTTVVVIENDSSSPPDFRPRSFSDPIPTMFDNQNDTSPRRCVSRSPDQSNEIIVSSSHSHSESEVYDGHDKIQVHLKTPTEMTDLSSGSSGTVNKLTGQGFSKTHQGRGTSSNLPTSKSSKVQASSHSNSPEPEFMTPTVFADSDMYQLNGANYLQNPSRNGKRQIVSSSTATSPSIYQTANEESSEGPSTHSESSTGSRSVQRSHQRRVVMKGERITTESVPDETLPRMDGDDQQMFARQSTPVSRSHPAGTPTTCTNIRTVEISGLHDGDVELNKSRITPITFFDTINQIASSVPCTATDSGQLLDGTLDFQNMDNKCDHFSSRNQISNSEASLILSQLVPSFTAGPQFTRENSLSVLVSDCFPLFVCLSILVQHRAEIINSHTDFVGLSVILNSQARLQDVGKTLHIAKDLYKIYRGYQVSCLGEDSLSLNTWLDDDRIGNGISNQDDQQVSESTGVIRTSNRQNSRDSHLSDSVFIEGQ